MRNAAALVSLVLLAVAAPVMGGVVINEIMYNPSTALGSDSDYEWVELYNDGGSSVDISGWTLSDNSSTQTIDAGTTLESGAYIVLARDDSIFAAHYGASVPLAAWTGGWSGLGNGGDELTLADASDATVDFLEYDDTASWGSDYGDDNTTPDHDGDGASLARIDPSGTSDDPDNWESSIDEDSGIPDEDWPGHDESHGTPGAWNETGMALEAGSWASIKAVFE